MAAISKKGIAMAAAVVSAATSTVIVAGGILLAIGGSSLAMAVGAGAAAIGAARAYSRLRKAPSRSIINKILTNPVLKVATSTVVFFAGWGLALLTALSGGGTLPFLFGALMMASGAAGAVTGAVATVVGGIKLAAKAFSHKKNNKAAPTKEQPPPAKPKTGLIADQSAKPAFDAAAKYAPSAPKTVPSAKPANAPKGPKAASG